jgi:hypothetical protein
VRETFRGCETSRDGFLLSRAPVVGAITVTGDEAVLASTDYQYDPQTGRLYRTDGTLSGYRYPWSYGVGLVVDYAAGYTMPVDAGTAGTLPEPVERAAIMIAGAYLSVRQRDPLIKSEDIAGIGSTSWWIPGVANGLPSPEAEQLLQPYRRLYP